jgi:hypothetical protein
VKIMIVKNVFDMFYVFSLCFLFKNIFVMFLNDSTGYKNRSPTGPGGQILISMAIHKPTVVNW